MSQFESMLGSSSSDQSLILDSRDDLQRRKERAKLDQQNSELLFRKDLSFQKDKLVSTDILQISDVFLKIQDKSNENNFEIKQSSEENGKFTNNSPGQNKTVPKSNFCWENLNSPKSTNTLYYKES